MFNIYVYDFHTLINLEISLFTTKIGKTDGTKTSVHQIPEVHRAATAERANSEEATISTHAEQQMSCKYKKCHSRTNNNCNNNTPI